MTSSRTEPKNTFKGFLIIKAQKTHEIRERTLLDSSLVVYFSIERLLDSWIELIKLTEFIELIKFKPHLQS